MKRLACSILAALLCLALASCGKKDDRDAQKDAPKDHASANTAASSDTAGDAAAKDVPQGASAMRGIADAMQATGLFGDSMELHAMGDEYAADILEFTYGVTPGEHRIADYVISEQTSKEAYSFALIVFESDAGDEDICAVRGVLGDVYLAGLRSALEVYNPEAYAMCDDALIGTADGAFGVRAVYLIISDSNAEAEKTLTASLGALG